MKIKTLGVLVILLPLLATGCKQANTPIVEVPSVPEIEVPEIDLIEIDVSLISSTDIKPEHGNILLALGLWEVSNGEFAISNRTITVKDGTYKSEIAKTIQEKLKVDNVSVVFEDSDLILKAETGFIFSNGKKEISTSCNFLVGTFIVENKEDLALALGAIPNGEKATIDLSKDLALKEGETSLTLDNGKNIELISNNGAEVNGGGILTSLIVSGQNTTVTVGKGITINGGLNELGGGGGVIVKDGATFILDGGIITGNESRIAQYYEGGGAVTVFDGKFIMNNGSITGNTAYRGAGVYVVNKDGLSSDGSKKATFIMNGGTIENNTTVIEGSIDSSGGGSGVFIYGNSAEFIMGEEGKEYTVETIPTIKGNSASRMGSAITVSTNATLTINNGLITENVGPYGVIGFAAGGTINLLGGEIKGNLYGPLNEQNELDTNLASDIDDGQIKGWVNDIEYGVVSIHSVAANIDWTGTSIEGAGPREVEPEESTVISQ